MAKSSNKDLRDKHRVRDGVLWILSPVIIVLGAFIFNEILRLLGVNAPIINLLTLLTGIAGVLFMFIGPVIGIIKLTSK